MSFFLHIFFFNSSIIKLLAGCSHCVMLRFHLDTAQDSVGEFVRSWHNVPLAQDTGDKLSSAPCVGVQNDPKSEEEHKDG